MKPSCLLISIACATVLTAPATLPVRAAEQPAAQTKGANAAQTYRTAWKKLDAEKDLVRAANSVTFDSDGLKLLSHSEMGDLEQVKKTLERHQPVIRELLKATKMKACDFGLRFDPKNPDKSMPEFLKVSKPARLTARVLNADAARLWSEGDLDGAVERVAAVYHMSAHMAEEPLVSMSLVTIAVVMLANDTARQMAAGAGGKKLNDQQRAKLLAAMDRLDREDPAGLARARKVEGPQDPGIDARFDQSQLQLKNGMAQTRQALGKK